MYTMKVNYNIILEGYYQANEDLFNDDINIALEADTESAATGNTKSEVADATNLNNESNNLSGVTPATKQKTTDRIRKLLEKLSALIEKVKIKITNRLKLLIESDKGFFNTLHARRASIKPMEGFKAITYTYDENYLNNVVTKIGNDALSTIKQLQNTTSEPVNTRIKEIVQSNNDVIGSVLLLPYSDEDNVNNLTVDNFTREMISKYRKEKKEYLYNKSQIPTLIQMAQSSKALSDDCNQKLNACQNGVNNLKVLMSNVRQQDSREKLVALSNRAVKATTIYNTYLTILRMYYELKLERSLSARVLLKKFYQF